MFGTSRAAAAAMPVLAALVHAALAAYDYEDIVQHYCNPALDWGPIPERPAEAERLLQVQVFIRHGARTQCSSDYCWEGDAQGNFSCSLSYLENSVNSSRTPLTPNFRSVYMKGRNAISGNCLTGQLVEAGFEMQRRNGEQLRKAYLEKERLLPAELVDLGNEGLERDLFFRSTDVPRTKQSAMALLSGLFGQQDTAKLPYLTLNTMDFSEENMVVNEKLCPAATWRTDAMFEQLPDSLASELQQLCSKLNPSKRYGKQCFWWLNHLVDCLMSRVCPTVPFSPHNSTVPESFLSDDAALFRRVWKAVDAVGWTYFQTMSQAGAFGSFAAEILAAAEGVAQPRPGGDAAPKFLLWSGHDTGPMEPLYAAFGLRSEPPYWPSFASMATLELWSSARGPLARWVSNGEVVAGPMPFADFQGRASALASGAEACHAEPPPPAPSVPSGTASSSLVV